MFIGLLTVETVETEEPVEERDEALFLLFLFFDLLRGVLIFIGVEGLEFDEKT